MPAPQEAAATGDRNLALFCDFENIALGVRDSQYADFDMRLVIQKLLVKGSIVVKKAYCDWERYKGYKKAMHESAFELIEIPHVRQSGKNSADIRMVVETESRKRLISSWRRRRRCLRSGETPPSSGDRWSSRH